ncbi:Uncharacterised protein [Pseudomonas aeruginosa]|nr:Uncharacterised protein [Pseudomonas aeruginosa]
MNPLFTNLTQETLAYLEDQLSNNDVAGDDELHRPVHRGAVADLGAGGSGCRATRSVPLPGLPERPRAAAPRRWAQLRPSHQERSVTTTLPCTSWTTPRGLHRSSRAAWLLLPGGSYAQSHPALPDRRVPRPVRRRLRVRRAAQPGLSFGLGPRHCDTRVPGQALSREESGETKFFRTNSQKSIFHSTRPRRARHSLIAVTRQRQLFNPRAHAGRDLTGCGHYDLARAVSIHAPVQGATCQARTCSRSNGFNPRAMRGATFHVISLSTGAPVFQSTRPCGARHRQK